MKYFGGCDVGSTYTKAVILDENGKMVADTTIKSKINSEQSAIAAMKEVIDQVPELSSSKDLEYLIGTGYGRNKVPFADENISEISCHAMGVHVTDPTVKAIIDIGGQDVKGISIDTDGTVKNFAMNDKCAAGGHQHRHRRHGEELRHERQVRCRYRPFLRGHGPLLRTEPARIQQAVPDGEERHPHHCPVHRVCRV